MKVPAGAADGDELAVFAGRADDAPGSGAAAGDLHVRCRARPHADFERAGDDLLLVRHIPLVDALCGFRLVLPTLDPAASASRAGGRASVRVAGGPCAAARGRGAVVRPGDVFVVRGRGMPRRGARGARGAADARARGDLFVRVVIDFPHELPAPPRAPPARAAGAAAVEDDEAARRRMLAEILGTGEGSSRPSGGGGGGGGGSAAGVFAGVFGSFSSAGSAESAEPPTENLQLATPAEIARLRAANRASRE